jgi:hypothetical protein
MINIKLLLAIFVIYCVLFLLFSYLILLFAGFISKIITGYDKWSLGEILVHSNSYIENLIFFMIINIFVLYYSIKKYKISVHDFYFFGFITILFLYGLQYIRDVRILTNIYNETINNIAIKHKYIINAHLIFATLMMFINGAIHAIIAKLAYYYKLAE